MDGQKMRFTFGDNTWQQTKQQAPITFGQPQQIPSLINCLPYQQKGNLNFGSSTVSAAPAFGFQVNSPGPNSTRGAFPNTFSFGNTATPTPLANLFGSSASTTSTGFGFGSPFSAANAFNFGAGTAITTNATTGFKCPSSVATTTAFRFGFGTATATVTNAGLCYGNAAAATTNTGFSFRPPQSGGTLNQIGANASRYVASGVSHYNSSPSFGFNLGSDNSTVTLTSELTFRKSDNFGGFSSVPMIVSPSFPCSFTSATSSAVAAPSVPTGNANVTQGFIFTPQQPSRFHLNESNGGPFQFSSAASSTTIKLEENSVSSTQIGVGFKGFSCTRTGKWNASTLTNSKASVARKHCISGMKEYENKSFEELRLEDYDSNRKGSNDSNSYSFRNDVPDPNLSFFNPTQFPLGYTNKKNGTSGAIGVFFGQTQQNQTTHTAMAPSTDVNTVNHQTQLPDNTKSPSTDSKFGLILCNGSSASRSLIDAMSEYLGMPEASTGKNFAFDSLIAIMIISKMISIPEALNLVSGNISMDDLKTHLIRATKEFNSQVLSEIFEEENVKAHPKVKQEPDIVDALSFLTDKTPAVMQPSIQSDADTSRKIIHIQVKLPNGEILNQKFMAYSSLLSLLTYIAWQGYPVEEYKVLTGWPRIDLTALNQKETLKDLKLYSKDTVIVEKR